MGSHFFALFSRMKYIDRWSLMRNTDTESLSQHSLDVAAIAHALAVIGNKRLGKSYDAGKIALIGIYHDMPEIITGDMPTPVKYHNSEIREAFGSIEKAAQKTLLNTLPEDVRSEYDGLIRPDEKSEEYRLVKAADKISALLKCLLEQRSGNTEFIKAREATEKSLHDMKCEEAEMFLSEYLESYGMVLDTVLSTEE
ncbi:MAG: 5'-deoxynucleotidase [Ruminococcaceae bacterium]|nr:5'-deoxynucleotidase [Oscillospiraceae bacterium]